MSLQRLACATQHYHCQAARGAIPRMMAPVRDGSGPSPSGPGAQPDVQFVLVEGRLALTDRVLYRRNWRGDRTVGLVFWEWVQEARSTGHQLHCAEVWMLTCLASELSVDGVAVVPLVRTAIDQQEPQLELG